jgi:hypothetical protein
MTEETFLRYKMAVVPALCTGFDPPAVAWGDRPFGDPETPALKRVE